MNHSRKPQTHFDPELGEQRLRQGAKEMDIDLTHEHSQRLIQYMAMMAKWNPVYNLTALRDTASMVSQHLLDSLSILPYIRTAATELPLGNNATTILDVGTGGGLPGVVIAIMHPQWQITLIDPVQKKTAFLNQVKASLALHNLTVINGKVEALDHNHKYHIITSRAFASLQDFVRLSHTVLGESGMIMAMKGQLHEAELQEFAAAQPEFNIKHIHPIHVAQLEAQRHLIDIRKKN